MTTEQFVPEISLGEGPHEVFAWYLPQYRRGASDRWPIRIGRSGPEGPSHTLRRLANILPERPRYLLRLGCADDEEARNREGFLHDWFRRLGRRAEVASGPGWFYTNPGEIEEAAVRFLEAEDPARERPTPKIEQLMAAAFEDVTEDDWAQLPDDLTDRLDDHLHGTVGR